MLSRLDMVSHGDPIALGYSREDGPHICGDFPTETNTLN